MDASKKQPLEVNNGSNNGDSTLQMIKMTVHRRLLEVLDLNEVRKIPLEKLHEECSKQVDSLLAEQQYPFSGPEKQQMLHQVMDEVFGLGPLEPFLKDQAISDILVNGPYHVYIERKGQLELTDASFEDADHLIRVIRRIGQNVGRRIDDSCPMLDARLADGSRVNAIIPPLSLDGPALSIRRFGTDRIDIKNLLEFNSLTMDMAVFLEACVKAKANILISGGTGTGKTTLLNVLSRWIPAGERIVTIEDAAELHMQREHVVRLETRQPNIEGQGTVSQRDLLRNSLRMRPDRIIIGEVRGTETIDMLQAMNTGHEGSMTTVHANGPRDALRRIENMVSMAGLNFPIKTIREQMSSAMDILVHVDRLTGGQRKIVKIVEIAGMEGDIVCLHDIFHYNQSGIDNDGRAKGQFEACGVCPQILVRIKAEGIELPQNMFMRRVLADSEPEKKTFQKV